MSDNAPIGSLLDPQIWLTLHEFPDGSQTSVGVRRSAALALDRKGFVRLYRLHVYGASKREARAWADRQIEQRASVRIG